MYQEIPLQEMTKYFTSKGFEHCFSKNPESEVRFEFRNKYNKRFVVVVWSSCVASTGKTRGKGKDAIRVTLCYDGLDGRKGLAKATRVHRSGSSKQAVLNRVRTRCLEMYFLANDFIKLGLCPDCGSPRYPDSGRCTNMLCFTKRRAA